MTRSQTPTLSVVVPMLNEEGNILELHRRLRAVLSRHAAQWEMIFVDDGSTDRTSQMLRALHDNDPTVKAVILSRRFGHQRAITAGMSFASGDATLILDADLQDPPELLPEMLARWRAGFDVVYGIRRGRPENVFKRTAYSVFYRVLHAMSDVDIPLDSGDFALVDARVARAVQQMPERNRFIRGLRAWVGFKQTGVEYDRGARHAGTTNYPLSKLIGLALDGLVSYSLVPLRVVSQLGLLVACVALVALCGLIVARLRGGEMPPGWTSLIVTILFLGGAQLFAIGIVGEYLGRILEEVKQRPHFVARELIGFAESTAVDRDQLNRSA